MLGRATLHPVRDRSNRFSEEKNEQNEIANVFRRMDLGLSAKMIPLALPSKLGTETGPIALSANTSRFARGTSDRPC
jgi:hypothetical protein